jgi:hypothetical protein
MDWASVREKVVVSVIVAALLGAGAYAFNWITSLNPQRIAAGLEIFDIKNPVDHQNSKAIQELGRAATAATGIADFGKGLEILRFNSNISVGKLNIVNGTNTRSKEIEIVAKGLVFSPYAVEVQGVPGRLKLKAIDPFSDAYAFVVLGEAYRNLQDRIRVIHDDRQVEIVDMGFRSGIASIMLFIGEYWFLIFGLCLIGIAVVIIGFVSLLIALFVRDKAKFEAWGADAKLVKKRIAFIENVKKYYPEKMPKEEEQPAAE